MAGEQATRGRKLDEGEFSVGRWLEGNDRVGVDFGAVIGVDVDHLLEGDVAVGGDQEFVVGGDGDLRGSAVLRDLGIGVGAVGRLFIDLLEGDVLTSVLDLVGDDL